MEISMNEMELRVYAPTVRKRERGGFLAVSGRCMPIRVGAIADTEEEARGKFFALVENWLREREAELAKESAH